MVTSVRILCLCALSLLGASAQTSVTLFPSTLPASSSPQGPLVQLLVSQLPPGAILPSDVTVTFAPSLPGAGPTVTANPTSVAAVYNSQHLLTLSVPASLVFEATVQYRLSLSGRNVTGTTFAGSNSALCNVTPPAAIQSLVPSAAQAGSPVSITLTGQHTNWAPGATRLALGPGVRVGGANPGDFGPVTVISPTQATAEISPDLTATPGPRDAQIRTGIEQPVRPAAFTVTSATPLITLINPASITQGDRNRSIEVTGQSTNFAQGVTTASLGPNIAVTSVTVSSPTRLTLSVDVDLSAATGPRQLVLTTGSQVVSGQIAVNLLPRITQVTPATGQVGVSGLAIDIVAVGAQFSNGITTVTFGEGIQTQSVNVTSPLTLRAVVNIAPNAQLGPRVVTATTPSAPTVSSASGAFSVVSVAGSISGLVTRLDGSTLVSGAQVRLYSANPVALIGSATSSPAGSYSFSTVPSGDFRLYAYDPAGAGQIAYATGSIETPQQSLTRNLALSGTGTLNVSVRDSLNLPVANSAVTVTPASIPVPDDLTAFFARTGTTNASGILPLANAPSLAVRALATHPVSGATGTGVGLVAPNATATLDIYLNAPGFSETFSALVSLRNGPIPGPIPGPGLNDVSSSLVSLRNGLPPSQELPPGLNDVSSALLSLRNGLPPSPELPPGLNDISSALLSLRNGPLPGPVPGAGLNDISSALLSLRNGPPPSNQIPAGFNDLFSPLLSLRNGDAARIGLTEISRGQVWRSPLEILPASLSSSGGPEQDLLPSTILAGETVHLRYRVPEGPLPTRVEFLIDGEVLASVSEPPFEWSFVVPDTARAIRLGVQATSPERPEPEIATALWSVVPASAKSSTVTVLDPQAQPAPERSVLVVRPGLLAEFYDFDQPLNEMPSLIGRLPARVVPVSSLAYRNPGGIFNPEPFGSGFAPDFAIRFHGFIEIAEPGEYRFALRSHAGATLRIGGQAVTAPLALSAGHHEIEVDYFGTAGSPELELTIGRAGEPLRPARSASFTHRLPARTSTTGTLQLPEAPGWMNRISILDTQPPAPTGAAAQPNSQLNFRETPQ